MLLRWLSISTFLLFSACADQPFIPAGKTNPAPVSLVAGGRSVNIDAPNGFCLDSSASQQNDVRSFLMFGNCSVLENTSGAPGAKSAITALLTVNLSSQVSETILPEFDEFDAYIRSVEGRASLSATGSAGTVEIKEFVQAGRVFYLRSHDTAPPPIFGTAPDLWRGFFEVSGQLLTISLFSYETAPVSERQGLGLLKKFARRILSAN